MKVLLSSIGSRGDVQPLLALALELRTLGHEVRFAVPPNFRDWIESFGFSCIPIGPDVRQLTATSAPKQLLVPTPEQRQQMAAYAVRAQFPVITEAARGCDLIIAAGTLQFAARSVAEAAVIPYVFATCCPAVLPSPDHPPPKMGTHYSQTLPTSENLSLWAQEEQSWNELFAESLNERRRSLGLAPVENVLRHIIGDRPCLAADPLLGPPGTMADLQVIQTGAWLLPDQSPLPTEVEEFLAAGAPPVYFGFGSMRASDNTGEILLATARAVGLRSIVSQGWGNLLPPNSNGDCLSITDLSHERLFPRVSGIVHHGGAGTTVTAARAGTPQTIVPHLYDQYYWANRVQQLGIGASGPISHQLSVDLLAPHLRECLSPEVRTKAQALAQSVETQGARIAAEMLTREFA